ncbi:MucBP domain-containing protein, partial [Enterococcus hulanensis]|uniref:MucBP domain-containing protein n=1 Tax=Enterococcus hulanensis TaxID=2559929 RepID=UPI001A902C27
MSNEKKIIYRREPIKKYKMHKVKKHWVVKGGVAGAMIVGSVGAPLVPHMVLAAETENVDPGDGEEVKAKSLDDVQETTPTVESTTEAVPEATSETEEAEETTEDTTEDTEKTEDETKTSETKEKQARVVENEDGTKTWTANEDEGVNVTNVHRVNPDGTTPATTEYDGTLYGTGIGFTITIDNSQQKFNVGDSIIIPISNDKSDPDDSDKEFTEGTIPGVGTIKSMSGGRYKLIIEQEISDIQRGVASLTGTTDMFPFVYDENTGKMSCRPITFSFNGAPFETVTSTYTKTAGVGGKGTFGFSSAVSNGVGNYHRYVNSEKVTNAIRDNSPLPVEEDLIQISRMTVESQAKITDYIGKDKQDSEEDVILLDIPAPDGSGMLFGDYMYLNPSPSRFVEIPSDATDSEIMEIMRNAGGHTYSSFEDENGAIVHVTNVGNNKNGILMTETKQYVESGATSPVEFIESQTGIQYSDPDLISKINEIYSTQTINYAGQFSVSMSDDSVVHKVTTKYVDSLGNQNIYSSTSVPNQVSVEGQSHVNINHLGPDGKDVKSVTTKDGWPAEQTQITEADLAVKGYSIDKTKLPEGADPDTGEMSVEFPEEGKTTDINYYYTANASTVDVKYMLDTDGDGVGDESINNGADDTTLSGRFGQLYISQAKDYRSKNYVLSQRPSNAAANYDEPTPEVIYVYQEVGSLIIDDSILGGEGRPSSTRYEINADYTTLKDLVVPTPPTGYYYVDEQGSKLTPGALIQPAKKNTDTTWTLEASDAEVIYHYVNQNDETVAPDKTVSAKVGDTIAEKIDVVTGWLYVEKHADSDNDMIVDGSGTSEVTYVYKAMGNLVWTNPSTGEEKTVIYPNDPDDPSKMLDQDDPAFPTIPNVPGYTPTDKDGNKLELVDPSDPDKGFKTPEITDPSANTEINYAGNEAQVIYHYVDKDGKKIADDVSVSAKVGDTIAPDQKINVVEGYLYVEKDASKSDDDMIVDTDGVSEITYIYKAMGGFTWTNPNTGEEITVIYPNDPDDASKMLDQDNPNFPTIPYEPGYTPTDKDGNELELVDPDDPTKGHKAPDVADPTEDTEVKYREDDDESDSDSDSDS